MGPKPKPLRVDDLSSLDLMVMEALTRSRTTISVVALAATLWNPDGGVTMGADPVGLVEYIITDLGARGLLTYRLEPRKTGVSNPYAGLPHTIRLTQDGWTLMGYPHAAVQVNTRLSTRQHLDQHGDRTNFRKHSDTAEGVGPIETLPWPEHRAVYPTHHHPMMEDSDMGMKATASPKLAPTDDDAATRGYIRITPELEARVIAYRTRFPLVDYAELGRMCDLPQRTIAYILTDLPRLRATNDADGRAGTIKQRILWTLDALPMNDVPELRRVLGRADTEHDIVHALHDLHKQGKVDFKEVGAHKQPEDIHLTARGRGEGLPKVVKDRIHDDFKDKVVAPDEQDALVSAFADADPDPEPVTKASPFPLLDALLAREQERQAQDNAGFKYLEAAEAIKDIDPVMYSQLVEKASSDIPFPSPIEAEYLRYVAACPGGGSDD